MLKSYSVHQYDGGGLKSFPNSNRTMKVEDKRVQ